jgi:hypothetical protein
VEQAQRIDLSRLLELARWLDPQISTDAEHSSRVSRVAIELADAAGLDGRVVAQTTLAGLLHDVGKIIVPRAVLLKPGRLEPGEYDTVKRHPSASAQLAERAELTGIATILRHHHERWDGAGYPHGLAGERIPLVSRVLAIADAYDAMLADRPYRNAMTVQQASKELEAGAPAARASARHARRLSSDRLVHLRERQRRALGAGGQQRCGQRLAAQRGTAALRDVVREEMGLREQRRGIAQHQARDRPGRALVAAVPARIEHGVEGRHVALRRCEQLGAQIVRARELVLEPGVGGERTGLRDQRGRDRSGRAQRDARGRLGRRRREAGTQLRCIVESHVRSIVSA